MVNKRKQVGYYVSNNRCLKAYVKYNPKTKKYSRVRYNSKNEELKRVKVYKKKSECVNKIKKLKELKNKKGQNKKEKNKKEQNKKLKKLKFGFGLGLGLDSKTCYNSAPFFGTDVPSISPYISGTDKTMITSISHLFPEGLAKKLYHQSNVQTNM